MVLVSKERYLQDNLSIRLGNLASNLARIESRCQAGSDRDLVKSLLRESKFFIEWTAPEFEMGARQFCKNRFFQLKNPVACCLLPLA
ncbi:MAG: hypothetical protein F6K35_51930 [Okeania sp. SIO2H7]|nr:hypothetical protein [Okeania sp. SIO2H7]